MHRNKHLLLWTSLAALLLLGVAAYQEHFLQDWRQAQRRYDELLAATGGGADVQLRQVVQPELRAADRCVSCHVGMAPGEAGVVVADGPPEDRIFAPHPPVVHDPADFGCTVCHAGQGRATTTADAHGTVPHWPEPMLPKTYAWAGCGTCHTHVAVPNEAQFARGEALFERHDCLACHRIAGRGGTIRPGGAGGLEGPDLSRVGAKGVPDDWYESHLAQHETASKVAATADPAGAAPGGGPWATAFGPIPADDRATIGVFLGAQVGAPQLVEAKSLFHTLGCRGCHKVGGVGGDDGPDLTRVGQRDPLLVSWTHVEGEHTWPNWLREHFRDPAKIVPGSLMPDFHLSEAQIERLVFYMLSLRRSDVPEKFWPPDRARAVSLGEREFATDGATLYTTFCAACHGTNANGVRYAGSVPFPAIGNADFLAAASDRFLTETIRNGRPGRRMPAWGEGSGGLRPREIARMIEYLRAQAGGVAAPAETEPARWAKGDAGQGADLYGRYCAGCHGAEREGKDAPELRNAALLAAATDRYLFETIRQGRRGTAMEGFGLGTVTRPALADAQIESIVTWLRTASAQTAQAE